ncbi:MAG: thioredoxin-dependent thiol peroxidase [Spirochaetaceae bacterium]|jgi:peroxiredoxin Q/BCP|nr:thioredoxin-dependent thiol peroxidase [Spirochaetaceae bacterium]
MEVLLKTGDSCPDFSLQDQDGKTRGLKDYLGAPLLIYFYPKALTPGCTTQSCSVRDAQENLQGLNCASLGISPDEAKLQKKFTDKHQLNFPLLCDTQKEMAQAFGVWGEKKIYGKSHMGIIRSSFLINSQGKIAAAWYGVKPGDTVPNAMKVLNDFQE